MTGRLEALADALASTALVMAVVVVAVGVLRTAAGGRAAAAAELGASLALALEFLLAGGLLRLSFVDTFSGLAAVAAIVVLRRVISTGVRAGLRALGATGYRLIRA